MNIEEYSKIIKETAIYPKSVDNFGLAYCYLGLLGEICEFDNADTFESQAKEAGDVIWYITAFCNEANIDVQDVWNCKASIKGLPIIPELAEHIKKHYRDDKPLDKKLFIKCLGRIIWYIEETFIIFHKYELDWNEIRQLNYDKLMARRATNTLHGDGDDREIKK